MLGKIFNQKKQVTDDLKTQAMSLAIKEAKQKDPLVAVKIGAKDLVQRLIEASKK